MFRSNSEINFVWETHLSTVKASEVAWLCFCILGAQLIILLWSLGTFVILLLYGTMVYNQQFHPCNSYCLTKLYKMGVKQLLLVCIHSLSEVFFSFWSKCS